MQPDGRYLAEEPALTRPDAATRLRLVELRTAAGTSTFGGGAACVHTTADGRRGLAEGIARAVIGPRAADVDGTIEIAGRYVSLHTLPAPLLKPTARTTIDAQFLAELWHAAIANQRADAMAAHAQQRLDGHRLDAAIDRERTREASATPQPAPEPEPVVVEEPQPDPVVSRIEALLAAANDLQPVPSAPALALAAEFEQLFAERASAPELAPAVDIDLAALERRVEAARVAVASGAAGGVLPSARARIESSHRNVVEAERLLFEAGRKERPEALERYQAALADEHDALQEAGVESYASFLVSMAGGNAAQSELEVRLRAELELAQAEAALTDAKAQVAVTDAPDDDERELELRARAAQMIGHLPGDDPIAELRAVRVEHADVSAALDQLRTLLVSIGVTPTEDLEADAAAAIAARARALSVPIAAPPKAPETSTPSELDLLLRERERHEATLAELEARLEELERRRSLALSQLDDDAVGNVIDGLLDEYRAGELFAGRLPMVLDGALDSLAPRVVDTVARRVADLDDVQVVVVTAEAGVARSFASAGVPVIDAFALETPTVTLTGSGRGPAPEISSTTPSTKLPCSSHADRVSAASCAHCGQPSCVDCLVYVPGEAELWCVACAEALRTRNLRLLRRRGA